jgi:uncharacterized membrane protein
VGRADQVQDQVGGLGHDRYGLILRAMAVVVRHPDGTFTLDRKPFPAVANILASTAAGFLTGLVMATPMTGVAVGALLGGAGTAVWAAVGIDDDFVRDVDTLTKPGTSALFVQDDEGDLDAILTTIRGWGGTVLKSNVNLDRVRQIEVGAREKLRKCALEQGLDPTTA